VRHSVSNCVLLRALTRLRTVCRKAGIPQSVNWLFTARTTVVRSSVGKKMFLIAMTYRPACYNHMASGIFPLGIKQRELDVDNSFHVCRFCMNVILIVPTLSWGSIDVRFWNVQYPVLITVLNSQHHPVLGADTGSMTLVLFSHLKAGRPPCSYSGLRKCAKTVSQNSRDSNPGIVEYETGELNTRERRSRQDNCWLVN
jgi:hypothetical protein